MDAIRITSFLSSTANLRPQTTSLPRNPGPDEVLVDIHHAALNHVDILYAQGKHQNNSTLVRPPFTLGLEFAGTVRAAGPSTTTTATTHPDEQQHPFRPGDPIFGTHLGAYADQILVPTRAVHRLPPSIPLRDASALASGASVAYGAVAVRGGVRAGDWVLVHGAAGGIGAYACQIAKAVGARVIAGVRRRGDVREKLETVMDAAGCAVDAVVVTGEDEDSRDGDEEPWEARVKTSITGGRGVDVVIDNVGLVNASLRCLRAVGGKIVLVGFAGRDGVMEQVSINRVLLRQAVVIGYRYGDTDRNTPEETKQVWNGLMALVRSGSVRPVIFEKRYHGLDAVRTAMADLQAGKVYGKAVIDVRSSSSNSDSKSGKAVL